MLSAPAAATSSVFGLPAQQQQQSQQQHEREVVARRLVAAIEEFEHLKSLLTGRWAKGLLARTAVPLEYSTQRIKGERAVHSFPCVAS